MTAVALIAAAVPLAGIATVFVTMARSPDCCDLSWSRDQWRVEPPRLRRAG